MQQKHDRDHQVAAIVTTVLPSDWSRHAIHQARTAVVHGVHAWQEHCVPWATQRFWTQVEYILQAKPIFQAGFAWISSIYASRQSATMDVSLYLSGWRRVPSLGNDGGRVVVTTREPTKNWGFQIYLGLPLCLRQLFFMYHPPEVWDAWEDRFPLGLRHLCCSADEKTDIAKTPDKKDWTYVCCVFFLRKFRSSALLYLVAYNIAPNVPIEPKFGRQGRYDLLGTLPWGCLRKIKSMKNFAHLFPRCSYRRLIQYVLLLC